MEVLPSHMSLEIGALCHEVATESQRDGLLSWPPYEGNLGKILSLAVPCFFVSSSTIYGKWYLPMAMKRIESGHLYEQLGSIPGTRE